MKHLLVLSALLAPLAAHAQFLPQNEPSSGYGSGQAVQNGGDGFGYQPDQRLARTNDPRYSQTYAQTGVQPQSNAGGCLKYGAAGAVAGHYVGGGHAILGALAGCATGRIVRNRARENQVQQPN